ADPRRLVRGRRHGDPLPPAAAARTGIRGASPPRLPAPVPPLAVAPPCNPGRDRPQSGLAVAAGTMGGVAAGIRADARRLRLFAAGGARPASRRRRARG